MPALDHISIVHGDYRTGNFLFTEHNNRISALLDWEMGHLGDRHLDLAWATNPTLGHMAEDGKTFLCGGFLMGLTVGAVVLFAVGSRLLTSAHFTLPTVQIVIGTMALIAAAWLATTTGRPRTPPEWLTRLLGGQSLWVAGAAGLGIALPSVDYLAALAVIAEQRARIAQSGELIFEGSLAMVERHARAVAAAAE
jgi:hypothetical protein